MIYKDCKNTIFLPFVAILVSCSCQNNIPSFESNEIVKMNSQVVLTNSEKSNGDFFNSRDIKFSHTLQSLSENALTKNKVLSPDENGNIKVLVLPIEFNDFSFDNAMKDVIKNKINLAFNSHDDNKVAFESVKSFYKKSSFNKVNIDFEVASFYKTNKNSSYYVNESLTKSLIDEAINKSTLNGAKINRSDFDLNKDGFIDAVWALYSSPSLDMNPNIKNPNLRAYTYQNYNLTPDKKEPTVNLFSWASLYFMESGYGHVLRNPISKNPIDTHTYIHETGHLFGLNDYYDYNNNSFPISGLDMMDFNVIDHNSYSKLILGWIKPYIVYGNASINLNEVKNENSCVVVLKDKKDIVKDEEGNVYFNPFSEYLLIEPFIYENSLNTYDLKNGYSPRKIEANSTFMQDGYRIYHCDGRKGLITSKDNVESFSFYDSNVPLNIKSGKIKNIISNTTFGEDKKFESALIRKLGYSSFVEKEKNLDFFNELTLIAKETCYENNFDSLYKYQNENGEISMMSISNNYLFNAGDSFIPSNYGSYFPNDDQNDNIILNNHDTFSSTIVFK